MSTQKCSALMALSSRGLPSLSIIPCLHACTHTWPYRVPVADENVTHTRCRLARAAMQRCLTAGHRCRQVQMKPGALLRLPRYLAAASSTHFSLNTSVRLSSSALLAPVRDTRNSRACTHTTHHTTTLWVVARTGSDVPTTKAHNSGAELITYSHTTRSRASSFG